MSNVDSLKKTKEELSDIISHCLDPDSYDVTPSDFDLVELDQDMLDNIATFE